MAEKQVCSKADGAITNKANLILTCLLLRHVSCYLQEACLFVILNTNNKSIIRQVLLEIKSWDFEVKIPLIIMTYLNPVISYGAERFAGACRDAGVSAVIIPDLPFEHQQLVKPYLDEAGITLVQLVTLTTTENRLRDILQSAEGFVYAVTVTGITGVRDEMTEEVKAFMKTVRGRSPVPVYAGYGISKQDHVDLLRDEVDGFIVGSAIVKAFHEDRIGDIDPLIHAVTQHNPV